MVWILAGEQNCSPMEEAEAGILGVHHLQPPIRLACATKILGPMRVQILIREEDEAETLMNNPAEIFPALPGTQEPLVLVHARLHGFEALAAKSTAFDGVRLLHQFRTKYEPLLEEYGGTLCEASHASFMAMFGLQDDLGNAINSAMGAARRLSVACKALTEYASRHLDAELHVGIAIHTGVTSVGQIGSGHRPQWVLLGETRQTTERLLALTESAKASILVSEPVFAVIRDRFPISRAFAARMPGKEQRSNVFEVQAQSTGFLLQMAA
jgi:class 3 adenylate cyclase